MRNIFEDDTLPSGTEKPPVLKGDSNRNMPARPKRQVTPTPKQQERQAIQQGYIPMPYMQPMPQGQPAPQMPPIPQGQQPVYQYIPVNPQYPIQPQQYPQQGVSYYPVFDQGSQQPVYPQQIPVQYVPYGAYPQAPQPQQQQETPKEEYNPGTRVLFQSPDFENKDGSSFNENVGANFADSVKDAANSKKEETEDGSVPENAVEYEEVSIDLPKRPTIRKAPVLNTESVSAKDIYTHTDDISFAAYNAVTPSVEVEDFEEDLPPYAEVPAEEAKNKKKPISKSEIIRRVILSVSIIAIVISAAMLINEWRLSKENDEVMEEASDLIITEESADKDDKGDKNTTKELSPEEQWQQVKAEYPNVLFPANIQLKYAKLYGENRDFVGYLTAKNIGLNLPVVQTTNNDTYLNKNFYGKSTKYGCPFVSYKNRITYDSLDLNTVIYGHHMNNGTIFGALDQYKTIAGYKKAPVISFNTLYNDYEWKVFAVIITNGNSTGDNNYLFPYDFTTLSSQAKFSSYLSELAQRSLYDTGVDVLPTDKILTLSTCSHEFDDARLVVVARLVRPGESTSVDTSRVVANSSPRYPQAYYNKKGMTNPYKNASRWVAN